ncbi:Oidioi.mRNA.OKI2018_I69.chr1.g2287.t1.cds [Oikopleura dioica]|uniref:Oidioi.mRNA.OKI2018_I69.chr1.g2287.t1.cds n=1 Tax=Oikopleura dioica TaxID=34765 RepID=A0ABN7SQN1_OIKDI|nr:Oidioi.mRNA.OKI2018_I69.chr1.g2287.t1.cds [Oikopleura dioica]
MKLASSFLIAAATSQEPGKYKDLRATVRNSNVESNRSSGSHPRGLTCTIPEVSGNVDRYYCNSKRCTLMCKPGSIPDGRARNKCVDGAWEKTFPNCITCEGSVDAEPAVADNNLGFLCSVDDPTDDRRCAMTCSNGGDLFPTTATNNVDLVCNCHKKKGCEWREDGSKKAADLSSYSCSIPPTTTPNPGTDTDTTGCPAEKAPECTDLTTGNISFQNSWTCRNCFRIRASYSLDGLDWSDRDFLYFEFDVRVSWLSWGHPVENVESLDDGVRWKVTFKENANFVSGMMFDANLKTFDDAVNVNANWVLRAIKSCPCTNTDYGSVGEFTHYDSLSDYTNGACGLHNSGSIKAATHFVALDYDTDYSASANCGRCVKLKCECTQSVFTGACSAGSEVIAMVVDTCPDATCKQNHLDLSPSTWNEVTGDESPSLYDGSWEFVECPSEFLSSPVSQLYIKEGSSQWWNAFQPTNTRFGVNFMSINGRELSLSNGVGDNFYFDGARNTEGDEATLVISTASDIDNNVGSFLDFDALL